MRIYAIPHENYTVRPFWQNVCDFITKKTLMTNLCCFGNIFYVVFGRTVELSTIKNV